MYSWTPLTIKDLWKPVINRLKEFNLIAEDGIIILEESKDVEIDQSKFNYISR